MLCLNIANIRYRTSKLRDVEVTPMMGNIRFANQCSVWTWFRYRVTPGFVNPRLVPKDILLPKGSQAKQLDSSRLF